MFKLVKKPRFLTLNQELILSWIDFLIARNEQHESMLETESLSLK